MQKSSQVLVRGINVMRTTAGLQKYIITAELYT